MISDPLIPKEDDRGTGTVSIIMNLSDASASSTNSTIPIGDMPIETSPKSGNIGLLRNKDYYRLTFIRFCIILIVLASYEMMVFGLCYSVSHEGILFPIYYAQQNVYDAAEGVTMHMSQGLVGTLAFNDTIVLMQTALQEWTSTIQRVTVHGNKIWWIQFVGTMTSLFIIVVVGILAIIYRNLPVVRTRGREFLLQTFSSGILMNLNLLYLVSAFLLKFSSFDVELIPENQKHFENEARILQIHIIASIVLAWVFACYFLGAFVQRQRMISMIFNPKGLVMKRIPYMTFFPLHLLVAAATSSTFLIWYFFYNMETTLKWTAVAAYVCPIVYGIWFGYYIYLSREASSRFSDFYVNVRVLSIFVSTLLLSITISAVYPYSLWANAIGWFVPVRLSSTVFFLDQLQCLWLQHRYSIVA